MAQGLKAPEDYTVDDLLDAVPARRVELYIPGGEVYTEPAPKPDLEVFATRDLSEDDLISLEVARRDARPTKYDIPAVRDKHHEIARMIVLGFKHTEIEKVVGTRASTISNIKKSPGMQQLIAYYQEKRDAATVSDPLARMKLTAFEGMGRLHKAVQDPETPLPQVQKIVESMLDRTGHPAVQRAETTNHGGLSDEDLKAIKLAARQTNAKTLPGSASGETTSPSDGSPEEGAPWLGGAGQDL